MVDKNGKLMSTKKAITRKEIEINSVNGRCFSLIISIIIVESEMEIINVRLPVVNPTKANTKAGITNKKSDFFEKKKHR